HIILEPVGRNTAPALTIAALHSTHNSEDPILLVMPADHVIEDLKEFHNAVNKGLSEAETESIVTFGIVPAYAETGYGYINTVISTQSEEVLTVKCFVEKPDKPTAEQYVANGGYYWNSGMFMMRASIWLQAMEQFQPEMLAACKTAYEKGISDNDFMRLDHKSFKICPSDSIDYAIMEKITSNKSQPIKGAMVPLKAGWSDVGAWDAVWSIAKKDSSGNVTTGDVILENSYNSLVHASSHLVACIGIDNLVVVETPDAVLVTNKDEVQDIKKIVTHLKNEGRPETVNHRKVYKPWGWYESLDRGEQFQVKHILINPGAKLSLQIHEHRAEHWIIVRGSAEITCGEEVLLLTENQTVFIPRGAKHRIENKGDAPLEIIEVQYGSYLGEDDIIRLDDIYGRASDMK
ncbi:MAG: mannose-1-phosphate guanylyltransferase/mannose-6-phosphate isomerase, partial [Smithella sp.]